LMLDSADHIEIRAEAVLKLIDKLFSQGVSQVVCQEIGDTLLKEPLVKEIKVYQNVVESLADRFHKKMNPIQFVGENTKLYLSPYQDLFSSLIHSIRNALDHGIELPAQRQISGKNEFGTITFKISTFQKKSRNWIRITIEDDGAGIDIDKLKAKLLKTYSADEISNLTEYNLIQHVFDSGLSTKDQVEETSGRGIGMSAIKSAAERLGGAAWVEMVVNMGTKVVVEVPEISFIAQKAQAA
ncbi:MAG: ATP-binding protein, partial [Bdellovibrionales bacterium]